MKPIFRDRREAGAILAARLAAYGHRSDVLVLGLGRSGVPVGYEIARALGAGLDIFVLRKLEVPGREDVTMGAIAAGGVRVLDWATIAALDIAQGTIEEVARREAVELARRERTFRGKRPPPKMTGRTLILVDDGWASTWRMRAAVDALRAYHPARVIVALPRASAEMIGELRTRAEELVVAETPEPGAAFASHDTFGPVSDREVQKLLSAAAELRAQGDSRLAL